MNCISDQTPSAAEVTEQQTASSLEIMWEPTNALIHLGMKQEALGIWIRSLEDFATEERQRGLPSLPARDPRFPQPPIYLCDKIL